MNKQQLVKAVAHEAGVHPAICRQVLEATLAYITSNFRTELRGFGVFQQVAVKQVGVRAGKPPVVRLRFRQTKRRKQNEIQDN